MFLSKSIVDRLRTAILTMAIVTPCIFAVHARTFEAEGVGYNRDGAVRAALRNAVEQCVGVTLDSKTVVENSMVISDKILTRVTGYVSQYTVRSETPDHGLVRVRISADVSVKKLEDDLAARKLLYELKNKPRIMVLLDEWVGDKQMMEKTGTFKFQESLVKQGFIVVESEQYDKIMKAGAIGDQASMAFKEGADIIIRGVVRVAPSTPKQIYGTQFYTVPVQMNARIVRADNAQIIASRTKSISKNSREAESAAQFGLTLGGEELAGEIIKDLNDFWNSEAYNENRVTLSLIGFTEKERTALEALVDAYPCTRTVRLRYIEGKNALYDLELRGTVQDLREAVKNDKKANLAIASMSANNVVLKKNAATPDHTAMDNTEPEIDIASFSIQDIFPSRLGFYNTHPAASLKIQCGAAPLQNLKVSVFVPELMDLPSEVKIDGIEPSSEREVPVTLVFNGKKVMNNRENRTLSGQAVLSFVQGKVSRERKLTAPLRVFGSNAIDWATPDAVAAFVTYRAPVVTSLGADAVRALGMSPADDNGLWYGLALFELMRALGITYVKDPAALPGTALLDQVSFPQETLEKRAGDCDDLAVLYASLLSSVGVTTAIVSFTDHVLVMFDTKIFEKNRASLSLDPAAAIAYNGTLWIPVETVMLANGFSEAWRSASREFNEKITIGEQVDIVDLGKAWQTYPPVPMPACSQKFAFQGLAAAISAEKRKLETMAEKSLDSAASRLAARADKPSLCNELGVIKVRQESYDTAAQWFKKAASLDTDPGYASNLACALLLTGKEEEALKLLESLYRRDSSGRIALNRGLCLFVKATTDSGMERAVQALRDAAQMMPDKGKFAEYLGIDLSDGTVAAKGDAISEAKQKEIDRRRLKDLIRKRVLDKKRVSGTTTETSWGSVADGKKAIALPFGGIRGADPEQISKVKDLLYWFE